jgi:hypothetical protein
MYEREDLERLVRAARRAARKLKVEYDRVADALDRNVPNADESWAEGEALWDALRPFEKVGRDA